MDENTQPPVENSPLGQIVTKLREANNVLVTVSKNPSVDQLSAMLGLTLLLDDEDKHAAAVFSGQIPSTIEFLKPEDVIEENTDSLRDFIIALDKSKADHLRYKVEGDVVRIFITPYKTSISQADLDFSQGDFNVDVVVAIGVASQEDLDQAITAHGRILHDATVVTITTDMPSPLGSINWSETGVSSLSEMVTTLAQQLEPNKIDAQIATSLLTGVVSETERFRNEKTSPVTMSVAAVLMQAGANQQLVAEKLEEPEVPQETPTISSDEPEQEPKEEEPKKDDGSIDINHDSEPKENDEPAKTPPEIEVKPSTAPVESENREAPAPAEPEKPVDEPKSEDKIPEQSNPMDTQIVTPEAVTEVVADPKEESKLEPKIEVMAHPAPMLSVPGLTDTSTGSVFTADATPEPPKLVPAPVVVPPSSVTPAKPSESLQALEDAVAAAAADSEPLMPPPIAALNAQPLPEVRHDSPSSEPEETGLPMGATTDAVAPTVPGPQITPTPSGPPPAPSNTTPPPVPPPMFQINTTPTPPSTSPSGPNNLQPPSGPPPAP